MDKLPPYGYNGSRVRVMGRCSDGLWMRWGQPPFLRPRSVVSDIQGWGCLAFQTVLHYLFGFRCLGRQMVGGAFRLTPDCFCFPGLIRDVEVGYVPEWEYANQGICNAADL